MECQGKPFDRFIWGDWNLIGFPESILVYGPWDGARRFKRARWQKPEEGVIEQYREDVETRSMHLKVLVDGSFVIDHCDSFNPDTGAVNAIAHVMEDTPVGDFTKGAVVVGSVLLALVGAAALLK